VIFSASTRSRLPGHFDAAVHTRPGVGVALLDELATRTKRPVLTRRKVELILRIGFAPSGDDCRGVGSLDCSQSWSLWVNLCWQNSE